MGLAVSYVDGAESDALIDASDYIDRAMADCGLQRRVVEIPVGRFEMHRYLLLPSHTIPRGQGE